MAEKYIAVVPAYEPGPVLIGLLSRLREEEFEIIVVDDGSGPDYAPLFEEAAGYATVLTHAANAGKGAALKTGLSHANRAATCSKSTFFSEMYANNA